MADSGETPALPVASLSMDAVATAPDPRREARIGVAYGMAAYCWWGFFPAYLKQISHVASLEIVAHRVFWCLVFLLALVAWLGGLGEVRKALREWRILRTLICTTSLISINWLLFIYAVNNGMILQASLGYFINPLVSVALGALVLGERLRPAQKASVLIAAAGVAVQTYGFGQFPWIAVLLACSFASYGLLRKTARVGSLHGLTVETLLLAPLTGGYIAWLMLTGEGSFIAGSLHDDLFLLFSGVVTGLPLIWFTCAARRLPLSTIGFMQYLAPSLQFLLAVAVYGEPFRPVTAVAFALIWVGLAVYTVDALKHVRRRSI